MCVEEVTERQSHSIQIFDFDLTLTLIAFIFYHYSKTNRGESAFSGFFITLFT